MVFSGIDKSLLLRAARILESQAAAVEKNVAGHWAGKRGMKQQFDALHRDARDLRALVKRLAAMSHAPLALDKLRARIHVLRLDAPDTLPGTPDHLTEIFDLVEQVYTEVVG